MLTQLFKKENWHVIISILEIWHHFYGFPHKHRFRHQEDASVTGKLVCPKSKIMQYIRGIQLIVWSDLRWEKSFWRVSGLAVIAMKNDFSLLIFLPLATWGLDENFTKKGQESKTIQAYQRGQNLLHHGKCWVVSAKMLVSSFGVSSLVITKA